MLIVILILMVIIRVVKLVHLKKYQIRDQQQLLAKFFATKLVLVIIIGVRVIKFFNFKVE